MKTSVFKSEVSRDKFRAYYNDLLARFPFEKRYFQTSFGQTFMLVAGQESNPPIILLHGSCSNSAFWFPEILGFSDKYRVYAIDIIGEAGNSEEYRPEIDSQEFAIWMKEIHDKLGIEKSILIGNSLGGWMALKFATIYPQCVSNLILIASSGLADVQLQFLENVNKAQSTDGNLSVTSDIIGDHNIPKEVLDFMNLIVESYNPIQYLPLYTDLQLQKLNMPILFIDGENDVIIDAKKSAQRLKQLIPTAVIQLLPNCGHVITNSLDFIIPFLA